MLELGLLVDILDGLVGGETTRLGRVDILLEGSLGFSPRGLLGRRGAGHPCQIRRDTAVAPGPDGSRARARTLGAAATFSLIATISATSTMMRGDGYRRADGRVAGSRRGFGERAR